MTYTDMSSMTEFIYSQCWSPNFKLSLFGDAAEGTLGVYRSLHYPFQLSKSTVTSVNPHNAGQIVGALLWLVELAEADEERGLGPTTTKNLEECPDIDQLWMNYLTASFRANGKPAVQANLEAELKEQLEHQAQLLQQLIDEEQKQADECQASLAEEERKAGEGQAAEAALKRQIEEMLGDEPRCDQAIKDTGCANARLEDELASLQRAQASAAAERTQVEAERARLEAEVARQALSAAERSMLVGERASLQQQVAATLAAKEARSRDVQEAEAGVVTRSLALERALQAYHEVVIRLSLLADDADLALHFASGTAAGEEQLLAAVKTVVNPRLKALIQATQKAFDREVDAQFLREEDLARLRGARQALDADTDAAQQRLRALEAALAAAKDAAQHERRQCDAVLVKLRADSTAARERALQDLNSARAAAVAADARLRSDREQQRLERAQLEAHLIDLSKSLIESKALIRQTLDDLLADAARAADLARQCQQDAAPDIVAAESFSFAATATNTSSMLLATPARGTVGSSVAAGGNSISRRIATPAPTAPSSVRSLRH